MQDFQVWLYGYTLKVDWQNTPNAWGGQIDRNFGVKRVDSKVPLSLYQGGGVEWVGKGRLNP